MIACINFFKSKRIASKILYLNQNLPKNTAWFIFKKSIVC
ncbi:hypothetical protein ATCC51561_1132 [Campylobacter concisus ATCC 51561]|nr:hypothetical protein ATCC51561_1132 [Campylobacter concisus ATCC 51561]